MRACCACMLCWCVRICATRSVQLGSPLFFAPTVECSTSGGGTVMRYIRAHAPLPRRVGFVSALAIRTARVCQCATPSAALLATRIQGPAGCCGAAQQRCCCAASNAPASCGAETGREGLLARACPVTSARRSVGQGTAGRHTFRRLHRACAVSANAQEAAASICGRLWSPGCSLSPGQNPQLLSCFLAVPGACPHPLPTRAPSTAAPSASAASHDAAP